MRNVEKVLQLCGNLDDVSPNIKNKIDSLPEILNQYSRALNNTRDIRGSVDIVSGLVGKIKEINSQLEKEICSPDRNIHAKKHHDTRKAKIVLDEIIGTHDRLSREGPESMLYHLSGGELDDLEKEVAKFEYKCAKYIYLLKSSKMM